uniref:Uncharacterized protein n=1 Tax=Cajanus cajan TaxID=3821 RepID=A0A151RWE3_CAJCA|nr:hypothetical protein KK1_031511 [Cajanus cajan]
MFRLSSDGRRTFLLNLDTEDLKSDGWDNLADEKPVIHSFSGISIYEMHLRDLLFTSKERRRKLLFVSGNLQRRKGEKKVREAWFASSHKSEERRRKSRKICENPEMSLSHACIINYTKEA